MELSPSIIWLIVGSILIAFEVTILPGVGLLFAGLSAICVGVALITGWIESPTVQFITFFFNNWILGCSSLETFEKFYEVSSIRI